MASSVRRPGPRADVDVPTLLIDTAEAMYGASSVDAVSLRAVARAAGVAPAAVSYHFASKESLTRAVLRRRAEPVGRAIRRHLQAVVDDPGTPGARAIVEAVLRPVVGLLHDEPAAGLAWLKTFTRLGLTDDRLFLEEVRSEPDLLVLFAAAARRVLGDLPDPEVRGRIGMVMFSMLTALAGVDLQGYGAPLGAEGVDPVFVEQLALFTTAGLRAG